MAPCNWDIDTTCCPGWDDLTPEQQTTATAWAVALLDRLTAYQFNDCPVLIRPCGPSCDVFTGYLTWPVGAPGSTGSGMPWMIPFVDNGIWRNCGCAGGCSCRAAQELELGVPVATVTEVTVDGVVLDPSAYRLDRVPGRGAVLVRIDGGEWPRCQDMDAAAGEAGSFVVEYLAGTLPPDGSIAAGMLACQFAKACAGGACVLPAEIQSLTRNGVDVQVIDPATLPEAILTGVPEVDRWIRSVNPNNLRSRPRVLSPDVRRPRIVA